MVISAQATQLLTSQQPGVNISAEAVLYIKLPACYLMQISGDLDAFKNMRSAVADLYVHVGLSILKILTLTQWSTEIF